MMINKKNKSQFSIEFLLLIAAFFAFIALFASAANRGFQKSVLLAKEVSAAEKLAAACLYIDFYSLDGAHSLSQKNFSGFSSQGRRLFFGNHSVECASDFRFEGEQLKVENKMQEAR